MPCQYPGHPHKTDYRTTGAFATKREAEAYEADVQSGQNRGQQPIEAHKAKTLFAEYAEEWLASAVDLRPKTSERYRSVLDAYLLPRWGSTPVTQISYGDVQRYVRDLLRAGPTPATRHGCAPNTVKKVVLVLKLALSYAVRDGALRVNPVAGVSLPQADTRDPLFLTADQVDDLAEECGPRWATLIRFAAYTGLRAGEIAALRVRHLDLLRGRVRVVESVAELDHGLVTGEPKSKASRRTVALPRFLVEALVQHLGTRASNPDAYVFTAANGSPLRHGNFYARVFRPAVARALPPELAACRFHDLRHTCASLLVEQGAHPKAIQERLGHSSIQMTLNTYSHIFPSLDAALTDSLDAAYRAAQEARQAQGDREARVVKLR